MAKQVLFTEGVDAYTYEEALNDYKSIDKETATAFSKKRKFPLYYKDAKGNIKPLTGYDGTPQGLLKAYRNTLPAGQLTQFNKAYTKAQGLTSKKEGGDGSYDNL